MNLTWKGDDDYYTLRDRTGRGFVWVFRYREVFWVSDVHNAYDQFGPYPTLDAAKAAGEILLGMGELTP